MELDIFSRGLPSMFYPLMSLGMPLGVSEMDEDRGGGDAQKDKYGWSIIENSEVVGWGDRTLAGLRYIGVAVWAGCAAVRTVWLVN